MGTVYRGSDFKFDFSPVDGILPDVGRIAAAGNAGIQLLLADFGQKRKNTHLQKNLDEMFEWENIAKCSGNIVTTMGAGWNSRADFTKL